MKPMKFKRILCPTDFSKPAYAALQMAAGLAGDYASELWVVNVTEPIPAIPVMDALPMNFLQDYLKEAEALSRKGLEELLGKKLLANLSVRPVTLTGQPAVQIVDLADRKKVDLIVIATHGQSGWRRLVFGSVAQRVISLTAKPVLLIRAPSKEG
jgi:universal stress protein A